MLQKAVDMKSLQLGGTLAFLPANSVGDDIHVYESDEERKGNSKAVFYGLRQQVRDEGERATKLQTGYRTGYKQDTNRVQNRLQIGYKQITEQVTEQATELVTTGKLTKQVTDRNVNRLHNRLLNR